MIISLVNECHHIIDRLVIYWQHGVVDRII